PACSEETGVLSRSKGRSRPSPDGGCRAHPLARPPSPPWEVPYEFQPRSWCVSLFGKEQASLTRATLIAQVRSAVSCLASAAAGGAGGTPARAGPDVIVGELPLVRYWGEAEGTTAYSIATTSCNIGDAHLLWIELSNQHPVIAQNMYRLKDGRFEQIGMSWL